MRSPVQSRVPLQNKALKNKAVRKVNLTAFFYGWKLCESSLVLIKGEIRLEIRASLPLRASDGDTFRDILGFPDGNNLSPSNDF